MTEYVILTSASDDSDWEVLGKQKAASSAAAIRAHLNGGDEPFKGAQAFVAVPARSWQPVKVQVETALKFS